MKTQTKKIDWKRLGIKALEDGIKKSIEIVIIALVIGASIKYILVAIPGVMIGAVVAKIIKLKLI